MLIDYDIEKIKSFLNDFHSITGLTVSIWDVDINQLDHQPVEIPEFCRLVKSTPEGRKRCLKSDREICTRCRSTLSSGSHRCHAGLTDSVVPIILSGKLFGFIMFGQIQGNQDGEISKDYFEKLGCEISISPDELYNAYHALKTFDMDKVNSAARILYSAAGELFSTGSIKYTEHRLTNGIDTYIKQNIADSISVKEICAYFGITKKKLYSLSSLYFGMSIAKYILSVRMERAKSLLLSSDEKINVIASKVGIPDYNYFTKVFKKHYGAAPKDYRRNASKNNTFLT